MTHPNKWYADHIESALRDASHKMRNDVAKLANVKPLEELDNNTLYLAYNMVEYSKVR